MCLSLTAPCLFLTAMCLSLTVLCLYLTALCLYLTAMYLSLTALCLSLTVSCSLFQCEASNGEEKVESTAVVRVNLGSFGTLPKNFPPSPVDFSGGPAQYGKNKDDPDEYLLISS